MRSMDNNCDGVLSAKELRNWIHPVRTASNDIQQLMEFIDVKYDGDIAAFFSELDT